MTIIPEREADIRCGILSLWILERQFPDAADAWDGNWLNVIAHCGAQGAFVTVTGPILRLDEVKAWLEELEELDRTLKGTAGFSTMEANLSVSLEGQERGQIAASCRITPDQLTQSHEFLFAMDQSYLKGILSQCRLVLKTYPLREQSGA